MTRPRARRRMSLGLLGALVLVVFVIGVPVALIVDATMGQLQWP